MKAKISNCESCGADLFTEKWSRCIHCRRGTRLPCCGCGRLRCRKWYGADECHGCRQKRSGVAKRKAQRWRENGRRLVKVRALREKLCSQPCADCGGLFPWYVMDFDHREPADKSFSLSRARSVTQFLSESKKCDVVCANCHRIRTYRQREAGLIPRTSKRKIASQPTPQTPSN